MSGTLALCVVVAVLTAFQFGFNSGVINQPRAAISKCSGVSSSDDWPDCIPMDDWQWGTFVSLFLLGGIVGGLTGGHIATSVGRRRTILLTNLPFVASGLLLAMASSVSQLYLGRLIAGYGAGVGTVVVPLYISEIASVERRGSLGSLNQLGIVIGVLFSQIAGIYLSTREGWRYLLALTIVPSVIQIILIPFSVETPKWLTANGLTYDARQSLVALRGKHANIDDEFSEIISNSGTGNRDDGLGRNDSTDPESSGAAAGISNSSTASLINRSTSPITGRGASTDDDDAPATASALAHNKPVSISQLFTIRALRRPLFAAFMLQLAQQYSGINAAVFYSTDIFAKSYDANTAIRLTLLVSVMNLVVTIISTSLIERLGRRTLLLLAEGGMGVCALVVVFASRIGLGSGVIAAALIFFVGAFGIGLGAIPWLILPELVPGYAVGAAASVCTALNWSAAWSVAFFFPAVVEMLGLDVFAVFAFLLLGFGAFTYHYVPETKGMTAEEVAAVNHF